MAFMKEPIVFSHVKNDKASLVDINDKKITAREAIAESLLKIPAFLGEALAAKDFMSKKGPIFHTANLAGIMAAKNTAALIPLCHQLNLTDVAILIEVVDFTTIKIECRVTSRAQTGVEMEALVGASVAALTIYDMCKSSTRAMEIISTRLLKKSGGQHNYDRTRPI